MCSSILISKTEFPHRLYFYTQSNVHQNTRFPTRCRETAPSVTLKMVFSCSCACCRCRWNHYLCSCTPRLFISYRLRRSISSTYTIVYAWCCWNLKLYLVQTGCLLAATGYVAPTPNDVQHNVHDHIVACDCFLFVCLSDCSIDII